MAPACSATHLTPGSSCGGKFRIGIDGEPSDRLLGCVQILRCCWSYGVAVDGRESGCEVVDGPADVLERVRVAPQRRSPRPARHDTRQAQHHLRGARCVLPWELGYPCGSHFSEPLASHGRNHAAMSGHVFPVRRGICQRECLVRSVPAWSAGPSTPPPNSGHVSRVRTSPVGGTLLMSRRSDLT
jgi:hypothetical protein